MSDKSTSKFSNEQLWCDGATHWVHFRGTVYVRLVQETNSCKRLRKAWVSTRKVTARCGVCGENKGGVLSIPRDHFDPPDYLQIYLSIIPH
jgi:hypothetical protein